MLEALKKNKKLTLRASMLWLPGILIIIIGILIHARVAWIFRYNDYVSKHAIACQLDVDLSNEGIKQTAFVPMLTREFSFGFNLHTPIPDNDDRHPSAQDVFSSNPIEKAIQVETFELTWQLLLEGHTIASGIISEKDLSRRVQALDIHYVFSERNVPLRKGQNYTLVAETTKPSLTLDVFSPKLLIRTRASLKGYTLVRWKMRDTLLCLALGSVLIMAGLLKQYTS